MKGYRKLVRRKPGFRIYRRGRVVYIDSTRGIPGWGFRLGDVCRWSKHHRCYFLRREYVEAYRMNWLCAKP